MPHPPTLLEQVAKLESKLPRHLTGLCSCCVDLPRVCAKLREVVEAMTRLDAFTWKFIHDHSHDLTEYRAWESVHYPVEHALVPMPEV